MEKLYVIAERIGGFNQRPVFTGTYKQCLEMMDDNPAWGYGNSTMGIHPYDTYEIDYL